MDGVATQMDAIVKKLPDMLTGILVHWDHSRNPTVVLFFMSTFRFKCF